MKSLAALAILAATSTALPQYEPVIPGSLPFMASMFTVFEDKECPTAAHRWTLSWRKESYAAAHEKGVECQAFNSTWDIWSIRLHYLDEKLSATVYTDTGCKENGVTLPLDACVSNKDVKWKGLAIRGPV